MVVTSFGSVCYANSGNNEALKSVTNTEGASEEVEQSSNDNSAPEQKADLDTTSDAVESPDESEKTDETAKGNEARLLASGTSEKSSETFADGDGSQSNPYQIETVEQLDLVRNDLSAHYILNNDIKFVDGDYSEEGRFYNEGKGWSPIGTSDNPFTGSFNGNSNTISGLKITADIMYAGVFGYISSANIFDLSVEGKIDLQSASSEAYVGSIAGYNNGGTISGCTNYTFISTTLLSTTSNVTHYVGGIAGYSTGTVSSCENNQKVECDNTKSIVGGIVGKSSTTVSNCMNSSEVKGKQYVGGIAGEGSCSDCHNHGKIINSGITIYIYIGGIAGKGDCSGCTNDNCIYASAQNENYIHIYLGGISGSGTVSNSINTGDVKKDTIEVYDDGEIYAGGIVGVGEGAYCKNYGYVLGAGPVDTHMYIGGIVGYGDASTSSNSGRVEQKANRSGFSLVDGYAGGISGTYGTVEKCYNVGLVTGDYAGGISGKGRNIKDCYNAGIVKSNKKRAGGITGINDGQLSTCYNIGNVQSSKGSDYAGGLSGLNDSGSVTNCYYLNRIDIGVVGDQYLGTSASLDEMKAQTLYNGFDFDSAWAINPDADYPLPTLNGVAEVESQSNISMSDSISGMNVLGLEPTYQFTGQAIEPDVTIEGLEKNTDYKVTYSNNINAGVASIIFTGIGNYSGIMTKQFRILPIDFPLVQLSGFDKEYRYTGEAIEPTASLGDLVLGTDYALSYENNVNGGTATITATGIGNYKGSLSGTFTIYVPSSISDMSFTGLKDAYSYTGKEIEPQISIGDLVEGDDYTLSYENNISIGTATIKATGKNHYKDELISTFQIEPADISAFEVKNLKETYVQTGGEITPKISIDGLKLGEDYTVAYSNNISIGVATIRVTGIGNYSGGIVKHFSIVDEDISNKTAYIPSDTYEYTGNEISPSVTIVGLVQDEDYTVSYSNNINVGTADILVKGINTFAGEIHIPFTITKSSISDFELKTDKDAYTFTGDSIIPEITVRSTGGNILVEGDDYTVKMYLNTNVGSALVIINGMGNFKGFLVGTFDIVPLSVSYGAVTGIVDRTYTGNAITQTPDVNVGGKLLRNGADYSISYENNVNAGTATIIIEGTDNYTGTITKTYTINKASNPLTVKGKTATLKYKNIKKKTQYLAVSQVLTVTKNKGKVTYAKVSGNSKISINSATGRVTAKKGLRKGTYSVKVKATAAGDNNYNMIAKTVTFKVKVK